MSPVSEFLASLAIGAVLARGVPFVASRFLERRSRQQFVDYVRAHNRGGQIGGDVGLSVHRVLRQQERQCEERSLGSLPRLGEKAPKCYESMGRVIALLDAYSSCSWQCSGGDHVLERLVGRAVNQARAAIRLSLMGFYDEALVHVRGIGETANLLSLFAARRAALERWKSVDERTRRREFSPVAVRQELGEIGTPIQIDNETYGELSHRNVHVNPSTSPQAYDAIGVPKGAAYYQEAGLLVCENELATALTFVVYAASQLADLPDDLTHRMLTSGRDLISNTGGISLTSLPQMWADLAGGAVS